MTPEEYEILFGSETPPERSSSESPTSQAKPLSGFLKAAAVVATITLVGLLFVRNRTNAQIAQCIDTAAQVESSALQAAESPSLTRQQVEELEGTAEGYGTFFFPTFYPGTTAFSIVDVCEASPDAVSLEDAEARIATILSMPTSGFESDPLSRDTPCRDDQAFTTQYYRVPATPLERRFERPRVFKFEDVHLVRSGFDTCVFRPDVDCEDVQAQIIHMFDDDQWGLDADNDGVGCEEFYDSPTITNLDLFRTYTHWLAE